MPCVAPGEATLLTCNAVSARPLSCCRRDDGLTSPLYIRKGKSCRLGPQGPIVCRCGYAAFPWWKVTSRRPDAFCARDRSPTPEGHNGWKRKLQARGTYSA